MHTKRKIKRGKQIQKEEIIVLFQKKSEKNAKKGNFLKNIEIAYWQQRQKCITIEMN